MRWPWWLLAGCMMHPESEDLDVELPEAPQPAAIVVTPEVESDREPAPDVKPVPAVFDGPLQWIRREDGVGGCGVSPGWVVRLDADGRVTWHGTTLTQALGTHTGDVDVEAVRALFDEFRTIDYATLPRRPNGSIGCPEHFIGPSLTLVTLGFGDGELEVARPSGCGGMEMERLAAAVRRIAEVAGTSRWVGRHGRCAVGWRRIDPDDGLEDSLRDARARLDELVRGGFVRLVFFGGARQRRRDALRVWKRLGGTTGQLRRVDFPDPDSGNYIYAGVFDNACLDGRTEYPERKRP